MVSLTWAEAERLIAGLSATARALAAGQRFAARPDDRAIREALKGCKGTEVERAHDRLVSAGLLPSEGLAAPHRRFAATPAECRAVGAPETDFHDLYAYGASRGLPLPPKVSALVAYARDLDGMRFAEECARASAARLAQANAAQPRSLVALHRAGAWPAAERRVGDAPRWNHPTEPAFSTLLHRPLPDLYGSWDRTSGRMPPIVPPEVALDRFSEWLLAHHARYELLARERPSPDWPEGQSPYAPACEALARGYALVALHDERPYLGQAPFLAGWIWQLP